MSPLGAARLVVVKVGSALLIDAGSGAVNRDWLAAFAADLARLRARGQRLALVSSGAVALGRVRLGLGRRALSLAEKQAAAAAGQSLLMRAWEEALEPHGLRAAQILLTPDDTEVRRRFLNARATLETLLDLGAIPVVNENDTVATQELRYGDNDRLAARVAQMIGADLLVLLSDVEGLYTADPRRSVDARHLPRIAAVTADIEAMGGGANRDAGVGSGGMRTKIAAARIAAGAGCATLIGLGGVSTPLRALEEGARSTLIDAVDTPAAAYKAWIAGSLAPQGVVVVDDGAARALRQGKSLLAAGARAVEGRFGKGDAVVVRDVRGREIARGLTRYDAADAAAILGLRSGDIEATLGWAAGPLIHADDLALAHGEAGGGLGLRGAASPGLRPGFHLAKGMRVGLYGGSFDPAHPGHLHVAETARRRLRLNRVLWLVAPQNPLKTHPTRAPLAGRLAAVRRLARGPAMQVTDIEARLGLTYTVDTVRWFKRRFAGVRFYWIMGADSLAGFHNWKGWAALMREAPVVVISRPGSAIRSRFSPAARRFAFARRATLDMGARPPAWTYIPARFHAASSTALRNRA